QAAAVGREPQPAVTVLVDGGHAVGAEPLGMLGVAAIALELSGARAETVQARVERADPEVAAVVVPEGHDLVAAQAPHFLLVVVVRRHVAGGPLHHVQAGIVGPDPEAPGTI